MRRRRGPFARLDDAVLGAPGTRRGWYGDAFLGIHPWLRPVYALQAVVGVGMLVVGVFHRELGLVVVGAGWLLAGLLYVWVARGKPRKPPKG